MSHDILDPALRHRVSAVLDHDLFADVKRMLDRDLLKGPLAMRLTSRAAYQDGIGGMDFYTPGRWDTGEDLVYMDAVVDGASPGEWTGTIGYGNFKAPAPGEYLVALLVQANNSVISLNGPWGTASQSIQAGNHPSSGTVSAVWTAANAGDPLSFTFSFRGGIIGYLNAVEVHAL